MIDSRSIPGSLEAPMSTIRALPVAEAFRNYLAWEMHRAGAAAHP